MSVCGRCSDSGWVLTSETEWTAKPCPVCNASAHERWMAGRFAPDFDGHEDRPEPGVVRDRVESARRSLLPEDDE